MLIDDDLYVGEEIGDPLYFIEDNRSVKLAEKTARVLKRERPLIRRLQRDIGMIFEDRPDKGRSS